MRTANLTGEELKDRICEDGICFVALDGEKIVGTLSVRFVKRNKWYAKGIIPDYILAAVLPEYQGKHINSMLAKRAFEYVQKKGYSLIELDTASNNINVIKIYKHQGFEPVDFLAHKGLDHYSIVMAKWLKKCKYPKIYRKMRYISKNLYIRVRYKEGRIKRFGI